MTYLGDLMRESEAAVRGSLLADEQVLATGRCADITTTGDLDSAGAGWSFVMVTDLHVRWVPSVEGLDPGAICSLDLEQVHSCTEARWRHRAAMAMDHDPLIRWHFAPNGRPVNWTYTTMDSVIGPLSRTILGFSRPTTRAVERLKEQLALRGIELRRVESQGRVPEDFLAS